MFQRKLRPHCQPDRQHYFIHREIWWLISRLAQGGPRGHPSRVRTRLLARATPETNRMGGEVMKSAAGLVVAALVCGSVVLPATAATISISCGAVGLELKLCQDGANAWAKETGNEVKVISTP